MIDMAGSPDAADCVHDSQFRIMLDRQAGIVRVSHLGFRAPSDVDRYVATLGPVLETARRIYGKVRLLADLRDAPVRTQATAERLRMVNETIYHPGERVALLVESSLLKMQLRRTLVPEYQNIFMSMKAAETWLSAG